MGAKQHLIIVGTVLLVGVGVTIHLGRSEEIGWVLAIVIVVVHIGAIAMLARGTRRLVARRKERKARALGPE